MTSAGNDTASAREDELSGHLYRQVAGVQAARYAATYDAGAGLVRLKDLLQKHAPADADLASDSDVAAAVAAGADACPVRFRPMPAELRRDADPAVTELYALHYRALVRLATLLLREVPAAEQVVHDSFLAMRDGWERLGNPENALAYLRQAVVNRSRSVLRHRTVTGKNLQQVPPDMQGGEHAVLVRAERSAVVAALRDLPLRQREAIVLRYYADLSEAEIATAMRISRGAVKSHTARGMAALRAALEQELWWRCLSRDQLGCRTTPPLGCRSERSDAGVLSRRCRERSHPCADGSAAVIGCRR
jgi:RNA polymerase sigma-70 factor (sigma-E family)